MIEKLPDLYTDEVIWAHADDATSEGWHGPYGTREEAEAAAREDEHEYVCEARWISPGKVAAQAIDMDDICERMDETDFICGTFDEPIFEVTLPDRRAEAKAALEGILSDWAEKYLDAPRRFMCVEILNWVEADRLIHGPGPQNGRQGRVDFVHVALVRLEELRQESVAKPPEPLLWPVEP